MLKNFWYAVEFSSAIADEPKRITVLGQELVLYRDSRGHAVCMSDLCVHRGGALSDGEIVGDCLRCPYHGWKYEPNGACVEIPSSQAGTPIPKKARVDSYPVQEKYGWIWVFLGDLPEEERPPLPELPFFDQTDEFKRLEGEFVWDAHYARVMENAIDFAHAPWVHGGSFGNRDEPQIQEYEPEILDWGGIATITLKPPPAKGLWSTLYKNKEPQPVVTTNGFWMPNITLVQVKLPMGDMLLFDANVPVDENTTITKWIQLRSFFKGNWADRDSRKRVYKIFNQDKATVEAQRPELLPYDLAAELHVKADTIQIAYRQMRNKWLDEGWGIDMHRIQSEYTQHQATVIPSPARRNNPELANAWVMKEVPMRGQKLDPNHKLKRPGDKPKKRANGKADAKETESKDE